MRIRPRRAVPVHAAADRAESINMKNKRTQYLIAAAVIVAAVGYMAAQQSSSPVLSAQDVYRQMNDTANIVLDVRTMQEHLEARIGETMLIPVQELEERMHELDRYKNKRIIVYCRSGNRSGRATSILREQGFDAYNMTGGIIGWKSEKLPIITGAVK